MCFLKEELREMVSPCTYFLHSKEVYAVILEVLHRRFGCSCWASDWVGERYCRVVV